jgi:hypothetical protein
VINTVLSVPATFATVSRTPRSAIEGLLEIPECAGAQCFDRALGAAETGDDDARQVGIDVVDLPHQLQPVDPGHPDVGYDQVDAALAEQRERLRSVARLGDLMADTGENARKRASIQFFVVYNENMRLGHRYPPRRGGGQVGAGGVPT